MRKLVKFALIIAAVFVVLLAGAALYIKVKYPPEKIKSIAVKELSEALKRNVTIGEARFDVMSGFVLKDLKISNRPGWAAGNMVSAKDISISYHLYDLVLGYFSNQVILGEIKLNEPQILIERKGLNSFNFSDMMGDSPVSAAPVQAAVPAAAKPAPVPHAKPKPKAKPRKKAAKRVSFLPVEAPAFSSWFADQAWAGTSDSAKSSIIVSIKSISIDHGKVTYLDEMANPDQRSDLKDLNLKVKNISMIGGKTSFTLSTPFIYSGLKYDLAMDGVFRYFHSSQSFKDIDVKGTVNGLGFGFSGDAMDVAENFSPDMKGEASLNMLKFSGLVPKSLASMPDGLSTTGPADVKFHLGGKIKSGLELEGTANASELAVKYKDMFVKTTKSNCTLDFKSVITPDNSSYDLRSFKLSYDNWVVTGAFHYRAGSSYSAEVHSASLPFKGLPGMVPKLKDTKIDGGASLDLTLSQILGNASSLKMNGKVVLKDVGITLPEESYLQGMNGDILLEGVVVRAPAINFKSFDGTGVAGVTYNLNSQVTTMAFNLKDVDARQALNADIDAFVTKNPKDYKDKLSGRLNMNFAGSARGISSASIENSLVGNGNYVLAPAKIQGYPIIKSINKAVGDPSDVVGFDKVVGTLAIKSQICSINADFTSKLGSMRAIGGINFNNVYSPNMKVLGNIHKQALDSDIVKSKIPAGVDVSCIADANGDVPVDFTFTGPVKENNWSYNWDRLMKNVGDCIGKKAQQAIQQKAQEVGKDLGSKLKGLFGK